MHSVQDDRGDLKRCFEPYNPQQNNVLFVSPCESLNKSLRGDIAIFHPHRPFGGILTQAASCRISCAVWRQDLPR